MLYFTTPLLFCNYQSILLNPSTFSTLRPSDSIAKYISKETHSTNLQEYMHPWVHCSIIYNSRATEAVQVTAKRRVYKKAVLHIQNGLLLSHKKNKILPFVRAQMDLEDIILSEVSGERQVPYNFTYMWSLKNNINKQNRNRLIDTEDRLMVARREGGQGLGKKGDDHCYYCYQGFSIA